MTRQPVLIALAFTFVLRAGDHADDKAKIACVMDLNGAWKDGQGADVAIGQQLPAGVQLSPKLPGSTIQVNFLDGKAEQYNREFVVRDLAAKPKAQSPLAAIYAKWSQTRDPEHGMSRGDSPLHSAVLKMGAGQVDFANAVASLDAGEYTFELRPSTNKASVTTKTYVGSASALATVPELRPGIFTLLVSSPDGRSFGSVPVLIAGAKEYDAENASFQQAVQISSEWPPDVNPEVVQKFLSLWLAEIADAPRS